MSLFVSAAEPTWYFLVKCQRNKNEQEIITPRCCQVMVNNTFFLNQNFLLV